MPQYDVNTAVAAELKVDAASSLVTHKVRKTVCAPLGWPEFDGNNTATDV